MSNSESPHLVVRAFAFRYTGEMQIAFFDEFGHTGPFVSRTNKRYNHSPVFGLAGYVMPQSEVRNFATFFLKLKQHMFADEIRREGHHPATWEKKGSDLITTPNIRKYRSVRDGINRLLNEMHRRGGKILYYGREKYQAPADSHPSGLYTTVLGHTIRSTNDYCAHRKTQFLMIMDQHSDRLRLLESATKTMFGGNPAKCLMEPPFQVESHLYQTVQAADWIAALVGKIEAYRVCASQYGDWAWAEDRFGKAVRDLSTHSKLWRPASAQSPLPLQAGSSTSS